MAKSRRIIRIIENPTLVEIMQYLIAKYVGNPLPFEFSESYLQAGYDFCDDEAGEFDDVVESPSERWQE